MQALPHLYSATSQAGQSGCLTLSCDELPDIKCTAPEAFGGPGDEWSPEELLMASVSSCLILSFKAIARASKLEWVDITCHTEGKLDRVDRQTKFIELTSHVKLTVADIETRDKAEKLVHKAEQSCLISNSLNCSAQLQIDISAP